MLTQFNSANLVVNVSLYDFFSSNITINTSSVVFASDFIDPLKVVSSNSSVTQSEFTSLGKTVGQLLGTVGADGGETPDSYPLDRFANWVFNLFIRNSETTTAKYAESIHPSAVKTADPNIQKVTTQQDSKSSMFPEKPISLEKPHDRLEAKRLRKKRVVCQRHARINKHYHGKSILDSNLAAHILAQQQLYVGLLNTAFSSINPCSETLRSGPINVLSDFTRIGKKELGGAAGGIYEKDGQKYIVKECQFNKISKCINEIIASKIFILIVGDGALPSPEMIYDMENDQVLLASKFDDRYTPLDTIHKQAPENYPEIPGSIIDKPRVNFHLDSFQINGQRVKNTLMPFMISVAFKDRDVDNMGNIGVLRGVAGASHRLTRIDLGCAFDTVDFKRMGTNTFFSNSWITPSSPDTSEGFIEHVSAFFRLYSSVELNMENCEHREAMIASLDRFLEIPESDIDRVIDEITDVSNHFFTVALSTIKAKLADNKMLGKGAAYLIDLYENDVLSVTDNAKAILRQSRKTITETRISLSKQEKNIHRIRMCCD